MKCDSCGKEEQLTIVGYIGQTAICYCEACKLRLEIKKTSHLLKEPYEESEEDKLKENFRIGFNEDSEGNILPVKIELVDLSKEETRGEKVMANETNYYKEEAARIDAERKEAMKNKGIEPLFKFPQGETRVKLDATKRPEDGEVQGRKFKIFELEANGKVVRTGISIRSPLYREFINKLAAGKLEFVVIRMGEALNTRYSIKE
jgi:hypothetical protein